LDELRKIKFPRSIMPLGEKFKEPILIVFRDGSREACSSLVYIKKEQEDGHVNADQ
jgi:hypothetical protein